MAQPSLSEQIPLAAIWPQIDVNIFVLDRSGNPAPPTDSHDFQLLQDGAPRTIQFVSGPESPISLALLIDTSGSTRQQFPYVVPAATALIDALPPDSEVAVVFFADQAYCDLPLTPVGSFNPKVWQHLEARGGTAFYDALFATETYFIGHAGHARRALVAITDGGDDASSLSFQQVTRILQTPGAPVLYILAAPPDPRQNAARDQRNLRSLTSAAGGVVFRARSDSDLPAVAARMSAVMRNQIALSYRAGDADRDGRRHRLEVRLPTKGSAIYGLPGFYAPGD